MSNPRLQDITEAEFQSWRHHPVTKLVLQYFCDQRIMCRKQALGLWEYDSLVLVDEYKMRSRVQAYREVVDLQWHDIENFYGEEDPA